MSRFRTLEGFFVDCAQQGGDFSSIGVAEKSEAPKTPVVVGSSEVCAAGENVKEILMFDYLEVTDGISSREETSDCRAPGEG